MHAISEFFAGFPSVAELHARSEGIVWERCEFWLAPQSRYNPHRVANRLAQAYEQMALIPPEREVLDTAIAALEPSIPERERNEFQIQAAIVRAGARQYFAM